MEHSEGNSHCGKEHRTNTADDTLIEERNIEHTRLMELSLCNGTWHTADGALIVERNKEHSRRMKLSL